MTENQKKLIDLLKEMFQFDQADLDFGIYRIMNLRRDEISKYLNERLIPQISEGISVLANTGNEQEIASVKAQIESTKSLSVADDVKKPMIEALEKKLKGLQSTDLSDVEADVYNHLINFFSRYYDEGDFISQRRYKDGVYAIPYEGEEVKLYWANADQYYVKTAEYFTDYTFKTKWGKAVMFKVVDAVMEKDNNKASEKRFFVLHEEKHYEIKDGSLIIYVEYRAAPEFKKQDDASKAIFETLKAEITDTEFLPLFVAQNSKDKSEFERQLFRYTAKNTYDYFIHKDLGKFLRRELDFYIKNEVLFLDDIQVDDMAKTKTYLVKAKVIREAAEKIIDFLAQIEDFQKKMYLKKKMVVDTQYCITLDRIPEEFYPEIAANDAQREEWVKLFAIDEIQASDGDISHEPTVGYSKPLTVQFLKQNKGLVLDTAFYSNDFKERIIENIDSLDENTTGLLINGENSQALRLIQKRYHQSVKTCYIDPPFNLEQNGDFLYKTNYKDSTWCSIIYDRLAYGSSLISSDGVQFVRCDHNGNFLVRQIGMQVFGSNGFQNELLVQRIRKNVTDQGKITLPLANDSLFLFYKSKESFLTNPFKKLEQNRGAYWRRMDDSSGYRNPPTRTIFGKVFTPYKIDAHFKFSQETIDKMIYDHRVQLLCKKCGYEHMNGPWMGCPVCGADECTPRYLVLETDEMVYDTNWMDIPGYSSNWGFSTENSLPLMKRVISCSTGKNDLVLDYFAGSGSTGHAVIQLNREDGGKRRFILCEMGDYFDSITRSRIERVIYGEKWQKGIPSDRNSISAIIKYIRLESYEDSLSNINFKNKKKFSNLLIQDDYMLHYMFDEETSFSTFSTSPFQHPFSFKMPITQKQVTKNETIDLVETFNYLLGLTIERNYGRNLYDATFSENEELRLKATLIKGNGIGFKMIEGYTSLNKAVLVIWRDLTGDAEKDSAILDAFLAKKGIDTSDAEYDRIYVNGDNNLPNPNGNKVFLIEEEFQRLMFED